MLYEVIGILKDRKVKKRFEAENETQLMDTLKELGLIPIKVSPVKKSSFSFLQRVSFNDIVDFTRQVSMMLNAGLSLVDALEILRKQTYKESLLKLYEEIDKDVRGGKSLSYALEKHPKYFKSVYIALVKAGEASGKLSEILLRLADNLDKQREFRGKLKGAMIYPVLVITVMLGVIFIMVTFVLPKLLDIYRDFDIQLPLTTQILMSVSEFSRRFWYLILLYAAGVGFIIKKYLETQRGKRVFDSFLLKLPVVGDVVVKSVLVESTRTLAILISAGVSILDALEIIIDTTDNVIFKEAFKRIYEDVKKGVSMGDAMQQEEVFPPMLVQMVRVGENTGHLDETLSRIAKFFEVESELAIKAMTSLIEPMILIVLALGVGFLVLSVITPIYNLTSSFG